MDYLETDGDGDGFEFGLDDRAAGEVELDGDYKAAILKLRSLVIMFKKSPKKADCLKAICTEKYGKAKSLDKDIKTRWDSLVTMINKFLDIKEAVKEALIEFYQIDKFPNEDELKLLTNLSTCLEIIKTGTKSLCKRDCDLAKADVICNFVLQDLNEEAKSNQVARDLYNAIEDRILERRDVNLFGLSRYLNLDKDHYDNYEDIVKSSMLPYPPKKDLGKIARDVFVKIFDESKDDLNEVKDEEEPMPPPMKKSRAERLDELLNNGKKREKVQPSHNILNLIKKEMGVYETSEYGDLGNTLTKLRGALATIVPTSVEAERAFSAAGLFVTKLRTSMSDTMIDCLCFLRAHFLKQVK